MKEPCFREELLILRDGRFSEVDVTEPQRAIAILQRRVRFLEEIINNVNANIYIDDLTKSDSVWVNKTALNMFGDSQMEMNETGLSWHHQYYHPDDLELISKSNASLGRNERDRYQGIYRARKSVTDRWHIHYTSTGIFKKNDEGKNWLALSISVDVSDQTDDHNQLQHFSKKAPRHSNGRKIKSLTKREKQILGLIGRGLTIKEIAEILHLSPHTVYTHKKNTSRKLKLKNMAGLAAFAIRNCLG